MLADPHETEAISPFPHRNLPRSCKEQLPGVFPLLHTFLKTSHNWQIPYTAFTELFRMYSVSPNKNGHTQMRLHLNNEPMCALYLWADALYLFNAFYSQELKTAISHPTPHLPLIATFSGKCTLIRSMHYPSAFLKLRLNNYP